MSAPCSALKVSIAALLAPLYARASPVPRQCAGDALQRALSQNARRNESAQEPQLQYAGEDQVDCDDSVQQLRLDEDQDAGDDGDERVKIRDTDDHDVSPVKEVASGRWADLYVRYAPTSGRRHLNEDRPFVGAGFWCEIHED
jgi:hypothetical protein